MFKRGSDPWITLSIVGLLLFGSLMILSVSQGGTVGSVQTQLSTAAKQGIFIVISYVLMLWLDHIFSYSLLKHLRLFLYVIFYGLMVYTLIAGVENYGSKAWINVGPFSLQPSELAKPLLLASMSYSVYKAQKTQQTGQGFFHLFKVPLLNMLATCVFLALQKDYGSMLIYLGIGLVCVLIPSWNSLKKTQFVIKILTVCLVGAACFTLAYSSVITETLAQIPGVSHIAIRIENMKDPYRDVYGEGYQPANSLYGIADAGLFGKGLGNSARKYGYLTQAESDYILAIVIEETGVIGLSIIVILYAIIVYRLFLYAFKAYWMADKVLLCGCAAYLLLHFVINIGGVGALIPMTGVPLLFISSGGTALIAVSMAMGMAQARIAAIRMREIKVQKNKQTTFAQKRGHFNDIRA